MIPAQFEYERVDSVEAAIAALQADEGAKLLAGGHSLLPQMKLRFANLCGSSNTKFPRL